MMQPLNKVFIKTADHSNNVKITIDDEVYHYSERNGNGNCIWKLDLSNELHKVRIESTQNGVYISIDAIDIDVEGNLVSTDGINTPLLEGIVVEDGNLLTWNPVENATGYNIKRATTAGGPYTTIQPENYYIFTIKSPEPTFKSIKEYIVKDKIVWFEVKEY